MRETRFEFEIQSVENKEEIEHITYGSSSSCHRPLVSKHQRQIQSSIPRTDRILEEGGVVDLEEKM
jgi:hypothetical protein